jgi:hypothetical protein
LLSCTCPFCGVEFLVEMKHLRVMAEIRKGVRK